MLNHSQYSELTPAQYEALGKLFVEWSNLEFLLGLLLNRLLFTPEFLGRTYSDYMNAAALESAINNALDIHQYRYHHAVVSEERVNNIRQLVKEVTTCRALRNKFAHHLWFRISDSKIKGHKMSGRPETKKKEGESLVITMDDLEKHHIDSYALVEKLRNIALELPEIDEERNLAVSFAANTGTP